jgi:adenosylhomocysteine nucleosidase
MWKKLCASLSWSDILDDDSGAETFWKPEEAAQAVQFSQVANTAVVAVVGLAFEAKIAAAPGVLAICRGPMTHTAELLQAAVRGGCGSIISFGVAGGLAPDLLPGDCIVASAVMDHATSRPTDPMWSGSLLEAIPNVRCGPIIGVNQVVVDPQRKKELHARTGAVAVDMESHLVARLAALNGLSFAAVRVIVDPAHRLVPSTAVLAMASDGATDFSAMFYELWEQPSQIVSLLRLAADIYAARAALLRLRRVVGPSFGRSAIHLSDRRLSAADR